MAASSYEIEGHGLIKDTYRRAPGLSCAHHSTTEADSSLERLPAQGFRPEPKILEESGLHHLRSCPAK